MSKKEAKSPAAKAGDGKEAQFGIQRIYVKDISFESPNAPQLFRGEWRPEVKLDINSTASKLEDKVNEVVLKVTVTAKVEAKIAFLVEVQQAGIFTIEAFDDKQREHVLGSFCPNILYPYAREVVSDLVSRGGYPQLYLAPINFDALFAQQQQGQGEKAA